MKPLLERVNLVQAYSMVEGVQVAGGPTSDAVLGFLHIRAPPVPACAYKVIGFPLSNKTHRYKPLLSEDTGGVAPSGGGVSHVCTLL